MHVEGRGGREEDAEGLSTEAAVWDLLGKCWTCVDSETELKYHHCFLLSPPPAVPLISV